jgi:hypothetical protein
METNLLNGHMHMCACTHHTHTHFKGKSILGAGSNSSLIDFFSSLPSIFLGLALNIYISSLS